MKDSFAEINIIPLVDIMLVLLVIVLMTANFMVNGMIGVKLPQSESTETAMSDVIQIEMTAQGELRFNGQAVSLETLPAALSEAPRTSGILVSADKDLTLQPFVHLLDSLKKLGFTKISIQTAR